MDHETQLRMPVSPRPGTGFLAWQATIGYMSLHHSPDARLRLEIYPAGDLVRYAARVSFGAVTEEVRNQPSVPTVLSKLWHLLDANHEIWEQPTDALKAPIGYDETQWFDLPTQDVLHRLIWTTRSAFKDSWALVLIYQAVENPSLRVQMRLVVPRLKRGVGGRGPGVNAAIRDLFQNAAPFFVLHGAAGSAEK